MTDENNPEAVSARAESMANAGAAGLATPGIRKEQRAGAGALALAVITDIDRPSPYEMTIQQLARTDTSPWDGLWEFAGDPVSAFAVPGTRAVHYTGFLIPSSAMAFNSDMTAVLVARIAGVWVVLMTPKFLTGELPEGVEVTDCPTTVFLPWVG